MENMENMEPLRQVANNLGAIDHEINHLLVVMKQKEMRRYKTFLFSMYNHHKIFVSIREFVWTHIRMPYLAEETCEIFFQRLIALEKLQHITISVTDMTVASRPVKKTITVPLNDSIMCVNWTMKNLIRTENPNERFIIDNKSRDVSFRYRHPEDPRGLRKLKNDYKCELSMGDIGLTNGSIVYIYAIEADE